MTIGYTSYRNVMDIMGAILASQLRAEQRTTGSSRTRRKRCVVVALRHLSLALPNRHLYAMFGTIFLPIKNLLCDFRMFTRIYQDTPLSLSNAVSYLICHSHSHM